MSCGKYASATMSTSSDPDGRLTGPIPFLGPPREPLTNDSKRATFCLDYVDDGWQSCRVPSLTRPWGAALLGGHDAMGRARNGAPRPDTDTPRLRLHMCALGKTKPQGCQPGEDAGAPYIPTRWTPENPWRSAEHLPSRNDRPHTFIEAWVPYTGGLWPTNSPPIGDR